MHIEMKWPVPRERGDEPKYADIAITKYGRSPRTRG